MAVILELSPEKGAALRALAQARGLSVEPWLLELAEQHTPAEAARQEQQQPEPFWRAFTNRMHALPAEVFEGLSTDGASEHDHYLYGDTVVLIQKTPSHHRVEERSANITRPTSQTHNRSAKSNSTPLKRLP